MTQATSYDELKDAISRAYPDLPRQLQRIARFSLERPTELALGTVAVVAESAQVQPSSLIRFANAFEFSGFTEMQQVFRSRLVERSGSYRTRIEQMRRQGKSADQGGVLHQLVGEAVAELGQLEEGVPVADVAAAVKLICAAGRVYVLAQRRALPVACYLSYAFSQLELKTYLLDGMGGMLEESLRNLTTDDVLVVTSFHSYSQPVIDAATRAHEQGIAVVAITDSPLSPLKSAARVCFELGPASDRAFRSLVAPLCLAQALVVAAGHHLAEAPAKARASAGTNGGMNGRTGTRARPRPPKNGAGA